MTRPGEGVVECAGFLEQHLLLVERGNVGRALRAAIDAVRHDRTSLLRLSGLTPERGSRFRRPQRVISCGNGGMNACGRRITRVTVRRARCCAWARSK